MSSVIYYPGYSQTQVADNLIYQVISAITNANPMVLTTVNNHNYQPGTNVSFLIPQIFGMKQLNGRSGNILSVTSNTMTIGINSISFSPFAYPSPLPSAYTPPTVYLNAEGPQVPPFLPYGNESSFEGTTYNAGLAL
jgi:hypothetical protein